MSKKEELARLWNELALDMFGQNYSDLRRHEKSNIRAAIARGWRLVETKETEE